MKPVALLYNPIFLEHDLGEGHPESPERLRSILRHLEDLREDPRFLWADAPPASEEDVARVHAPDYVNWIRESCEAGGMFYPALEGMLLPTSYPAALRAAGAVMHASQKVWDGEWRGAFALVRPPGHHAVAGSAMGFCIFNNVAVAAAHLLEVKSVPSMLIVDFDVHHGNGTQEMFYTNARVNYFSVHQFPHYPGTGADYERGEGEGEEATLNVPLPSGSGDDEMLAAFRDRLVPWAEERKPEILLISAGFDAHQHDPLSGQKITTEGYRQMAEILREIAAQHCSGRWVATLEGGYHLDALGQSLRVFLEEMAKSPENA